MPKKKSTKPKKKPVKRRRNAPLRIPLPFEQVIEALMQVPPKKKAGPPVEQEPAAAQQELYDD